MAVKVIPSFHNCLTFREIFWYTAVSLTGWILIWILISQKVRIGCIRVHHLYDHFHDGIFYKRIQISQHNPILSYLKR